MQVPHFLKENQMLIVLVGLLAGLMFPHAWAGFLPWTTLMLQVIFFFSALRVETRQLKEDVMDWKALALAAVLRLFVIAALVYVPLSFIAPDWALAFLIALASPTGMTIAIVADFFKGRTSLALLIALLTSALAPFTLPWTFQVLAGASVPLSPVQMLSDLAQAIILPFALAALVKYAMRGREMKYDGTWRLASVLVFGLLIATVVSKSAASATSATNLNLSLAMILVLMGTALMLGGILYAVYRLTSWRTPSERITITLSMLYMNFTLALYIGDKFFAHQDVVPKLVVIVLMLNALLPFVKVFAMHVVESQTGVRHLSRRLVGR